MPLILQYISFAISVISLVLTLLTFINTCRVNKKFTLIRDREQFHRDRKEISDKLEGFIRSIDIDRLHEADESNTLSQKISTELINIETKYTNLSWRTRKFIHKSMKCVDSDNIDWKLLRKLLTTLRNYINKEM